MIAPGRAVVDTSRTSVAVASAVGSAGMSVVEIRAGGVRTHGGGAVGMSGEVRAAGMSGVVGLGGRTVRRRPGRGGTIRRFRKGSPEPSSTVE